MAVDISIKYERLITRYEARHRFQEVVDLEEMLTSSELEEVEKWLSVHHLPLCGDAQSGPRCVTFRGTQRSERLPINPKGLLQDFVDLRSEKDVVRFAKRYGPLGQAVPKSKYVPKPLVLGITHYERIDEWLGLAALFRLVQHQIYWLYRISKGSGDTAPLEVEVIPGPDEKDGFAFSRAIISVDVNDKHLNALVKNFKIELPEWWNQVKAFRQARNASGEWQTSSSYWEWWLNQEINRSVFLTESSSHLQFGVDMFVRCVLDRLITGETEIQIGKGGFVFRNLSLIGVLANQLGAFYRNRGSYGRVCAAPGCSEFIDEKRRSDARLCPRCKTKKNSKTQAAKKKKERHMQAVDKAQSEIYQNYGD